MTRCAGPLVFLFQKELSQFLKIEDNVSSAEGEGDGACARGSSGTQDKFGFPKDRHCCLGPLLAMSLAASLSCYEGRFQSRGSTRRSLCHC